MNCREVQSHFEERGLATELHPLDTELAQHISGCDSCRRLAGMRKHMLANLCLLRDTAPNMSESLDASVIANYRKEMAWKQVTSTRSRPASFNGFWRLGVTAAAALLVIAAALVLRKSQNPAEPNLEPPPTRNVARNDQSAPPKPSYSVPRRKKTAHVAKSVTPRADASGTEQLSAAAPAFRPDDSQGFRSLMYCDELSCDGGMNVVRVQLPALPSGFLPAANTVARPVSADVLVGADGFARGIRIVH